MQKESASGIELPMLANCASLKCHWVTQTDGQSVSPSPRQSALLEHPLVFAIAKMQG